MAYNPGISYQGPELYMQGIGMLGQGIQNIGQEFKDYMEQARKRKQEDAFNREILSYARSLGKITPEEYKKADEGSFSQRSGMAQGKMYEVSEDLKRQIATNKQELGMARLDAQSARMESANYFRALQAERSGEAQKARDRNFEALERHRRFIEQQYDVTKGMTPGNRELFHFGQGKTSTLPQSSLDMLSPTDQKKYDWANRNPDDPLSKQWIENFRRRVGGMFQNIPNQPPPPAEEPESTIEPSDLQ